MSRILVYSRTTGYRHASIPAGIEAFGRLGRDHGFTVEASEDPDSFRAARLEHFDVTVFLNTSGEVLDEPGRAALTRYMEQGGAWLGVHAASTAEDDWPWYEGLVGARFDRHPEIQPAVVVVEDRGHPSTEHLGRRWEHTDEWYAFHGNPRERVRVLLSVDEETYAGGTMGADHPLAWCHENCGGRSYYTALGHAEEAYQDPLFLGHLLGALRWLGVVTPRS